VSSIVASYLPDAKALLRFARCSKAANAYMCTDDDDAGWAGLWRRHALFVWQLAPTSDLRCIDVLRRPQQTPLYAGPALHGSPRAGASAEAPAAWSLRAQVTHHGAATHRSFAFINRVGTAARVFSHCSDQCQPRGHYVFPRTLCGSPSPLRNSTPACSRHPLCSRHSFGRAARRCGQSGRTGAAASRWAARRGAAARATPCRS